MSAILLLWDCATAVSRATETHVGYGTTFLDQVFPHKNTFCPILNMDEIHVRLGSNKLKPILAQHQTVRSGGGRHVSLRLSMRFLLLRDTGAV